MARQILRRTDQCTNYPCSFTNVLLSELQERGGSFRNDPHNKWEKSSALTPWEEGNGGHEDLHENPERSDVSDEVSDECIQIFLSTFSQCSLGANEQPCSFLFLKLTVVELRFQCLKLTADQLDMLILGRPGRWTYKKKKSWYEAILLRLLSQRSSSFQENIFVSSLHIEKKRLFNLKCHLNNGCPRCPRKN